MKVSSVQRLKAAANLLQGAANVVFVGSAGYWLLTGGPWTTSAVLYAVFVTLLPTAMLTGLSEQALEKARRVERQLEARAAWEAGWQPSAEQLAERQHHVERGRHYRFHFKRALALLGIGVALWLLTSSVVPALFALTAVQALIGVVTGAGGCYVLHLRRQMEKEGLPLIFLRS